MKNLIMSVVCILALLAFFLGWFIHPLVSFAGFMFMLAVWASNPNDWDPY